MLVVIWLSDLALHYFLNNYYSWYNYKGYRGEIVSPDDPTIIACFGGSTTYGYGVKKDKTWPYFLEELLKKEGLNISVVNLGANGQGIYGISHDLKLYDYLNYDIAILFNGYNDMMPELLQRNNLRGNDLLFRIFGYKQVIWPFIKERIFSIKGNKGHIEFDQNKIKEDNEYDQVARYFNALDTAARGMVSKSEVPYKGYMKYLEASLGYLTSMEKEVLFVCPPGISHTLQQQEVKRFLNKDDRQVSYFDIGPFVDLSNHKLCLDGLHLTPEGNYAIAKKLTPLIKEMIDNM